MRMTGSLRTVADATAPGAERPRVIGLRRPGWASAQRRQLARQDRLSAQLAELHHLGSLITTARAVVGAGWVQGGWFVVADDRGGRCTVTASTLWLATDRPVIGACLVGAIIEAGGGPPAVRSQPVQRALDLTWHTLYGDAREPVRWCPAPPIRTAHVRDLTRWNDQPGRTAADVTALLIDVEHAAAASADRLRQPSLTP
jgi:hypothetical protein